MTQYIKEAILYFMQRRPCACKQPDELRIALSEGINWCTDTSGKILLPISSTMMPYSCIVVRYIGDIVY